MPFNSRRGKIAIFRADSMDYTLFAANDPFDEIAQRGVVYVGEPDLADIILARRRKDLKGFGHHRKRFAIWTDEPRFSLEESPRSILAGVRNVVDVMNAHTGTLYRDNYHHLWGHQKRVDFDERMRAFAEKPDRACILATYRPIDERRKRNRWSGPLHIHGENVDLNQTRQELAASLHKKGYCDVYGRNWPEEIKTCGESRIGNWVDAKRRILGGYALNIAIENTIACNYVSEKIWDAISNAALPIYHSGKGSIYDDFEAGTFIDAAGKSADSLGEEIRLMPKSERTDRYEACLRTYIKIVAENRFAASQKKLRVRIADFIEEVMSRPPEPSPNWKALKGLRATIRATLRPPSPSTR